MEKELNIMYLEKLYMKEILLMMLEMEVENYFMKTALIIKENLRMEKDMVLEKNMIKMV